jgi:hypothetical protein
MRSWSAVCNSLRVCNPGWGSSQHNRQTIRGVMCVKGHHVLCQVRVSYICICCIMCVSITAHFKVGCNCKLHTSGVQVEYFTEWCY